MELVLSRKPKHKREKEHLGLLLHRMELMETVEVEELEEMLWVEVEEMEQQGQQEELMELLELEVEQLAQPHLPLWYLEEQVEQELITKQAPLEIQENLEEELFF